MTHTPQPDNANPYPGPSVVYPPPRSTAGRNAALIAAGVVTFVCLGLCGLCGVGALLSDDDDSDVRIDDRAVASASVDKDGGAARTYGMNEPVRDGGFEFTVLKSECGRTRVGGSYLNAQAQGQFCIVEIKVKNVGTVPERLDDSNQKAFNASGDEYGADGSASNYVNDNNETFLNEINPGNEVVGKFVFDIPKDQKIERLELHASSGSAGIQVKLS